MFFYFLWKDLSNFVKFFGLLIWFIQFASYTYTFLINPGIPTYDMSVTSPNPITVKNYRICNTCYIIMDVSNKVEHCEDCNVCIEGNF
jgi:hypothetical protein